MSDIGTVAWPVARLGEALEALAQRSHLAAGTHEIPVPPELVAGGDGDALAQWIEAAAGSLGMEAEPVEASYAELDDLIHRGGPMLLPLEDAEGTRVVAVVRRRRRRVSVLGPDLAVHAIHPAVLRAALCRPLDAPVLPEVDRLLEEAGVPRRRQARARVALVAERLGAARICGWLLRVPPGVRIWRELRGGHVPRQLVALVGTHVVEYSLWLLAWWMVGRGALSGRLERGWLLAWALLLLTLVPFRLLGTWLEGSLAIGAGRLLKQRLLCGALRLEPDDLRHRGAGALMGSVFEAEAVESLALSGGLLGLLAAIELVMAAAVLAAGAGGAGQVLLLLAWLALAGTLGWRYFRDRLQWTAARVAMTHDLIERMVGHRTRQAQEARERWHGAEDQSLERYLAHSGTMDRTAARLTALVPRGWLAVGLAGLAPAFVAGAALPAGLAVGLGGVLLAYRAFHRLAAGLAHVAGAVIAWREVAPLFHAAGHRERVETPALALALGPDGRSPEPGTPLLEAQELVFRYRDRGEAVLRGLSLGIASGQRILLEGPSGAGKSTLVSLLIGLRAPESGLLLLRGLDHRSVGSEYWRRRVVAAPQFHENHVLTATFAFNALMGRRWPPEPADLEEVAAVCRELGLGEVLERMPAGLLQMVGEMGWQLSHGERSRLYIARALLQRAELVILDESFAALDPENLARALRCVLGRARTLVVIAHP